jgi:hypothetical protein
MPHRITQPTKEQVRAYMLAREGARRPPPAPEEIRRQLGWRLASTECEQPWVQLCLIPTAYSQFATQLALDWMFAPVLYHQAVW